MFSIQYYTSKNSETPSELDGHASQSPNPELDIPFYLSLSLNDSKSRFTFLWLQFNPIWWFYSQNFTEQ